MEIFRSFQLIVSAFFLVFLCRNTLAQDCYNSPTSQGRVTLVEGQSACAALEVGQRPEDLGRSYVTCAQGRLLIRTCPAHLRWDTAISGCNYPELVNCQLPDEDAGNTSPPEQPRSSDVTSTSTGRTTNSVRTSEYIRGETSSAGRTETSRNAISQAASQTVSCWGVDTSEGVRNLQDDQRVCAPLAPGESAPDRGRRFLRCSRGTIFTFTCQSQLRFDTAANSCNWPQLATCDLPDLSPAIPTTPNSNGQTTNSTNANPAVSSSRTTRPTTPPRSTQAQATTPRSTQAPPTGPCNSASCQLPNCSCMGAVFSAIPRSEMPRFIMLTFDDAVTTSLYNSYFRPLLVDNDFRLFNPSGCAARSTLYVSHENTDYAAVVAAWEAGNEIGSHTINHRLPQGDSNNDYPRMVAEIQGLKDEMFKATRNRRLVDSVRGFRAPYLRVAHDVMYDVLRDNGFLYDSSVLNINALHGKPTFMPYTFDYVMDECINPPCPTKAYPGLWEVPLNGWIGDDKEGCSMVDACHVGRTPWTATEQEWYSFFNRNFRDYFSPLKVPFPIFTHGFLFTGYPNSYPALARWLQDVLKSNRDVWMVTPTQVIEWMQRPLTNQQMIDSKWGC